MKKILLLFAFFSVLFSYKTKAQIVNNDFENWKLDTFYFAAGTIGNLPADTTTFNNPVGWTTSNVLTQLDSIGGRAFVTQSNNPQNGSSAIRMVTDTILLPIIQSLPFTKVTIPGFAVNGNFDISSIQLGSVSVISPASITGAGQPFNQRLADFKGYYNYTPVYNSATGSNDTCVAWATLRKGSTVIADAVFKSTSSTSGYQPFTANFVYYSCEVPDTLVILLASSTTNVYQFIGGLKGGSVLLIDNLSYDALPGNFHFAPFAKNDIVTSYKNTADTINVLANDTDCSGNLLTVSLLSNPHHGTASVVGNKVAYMPALNFLGLDSIYYKDTNLTNDTAEALLIIFVTQNISGITEVNQIAVSVYPVPASNEITIHLENADKYEAKIYDVLGNLIQSATINQNDTRVPVASFANGMYALQIVNEHKTVVARTKFVVNK